MDTWHRVNMGEEFVGHQVGSDLVTSIVMVPSDM